jgi:hypothetical protein
MTRPTLYATVHNGIWFNGQLSTALHPSNADLKRLCKALLDAGIPVSGYWRDVDYTDIDPRISSKEGRVP